MAGDPPAPPLPPARSGVKVIIVTAAIILIFLGLLWYSTFAVLRTRGPDRAFFSEDSWANGTYSVYVSDIDTNGVVPLSTLTVRITAQDGTVFFDDPIGDTHNNGNWSLHLTVNDRDASGTLSLNDDLNLTALPAASLDALLLSNLYLYSNGVQWAHFQIPLV